MNLLGLFFSKRALSLTQVKILNSLPKNNQRFARTLVAFFAITVFSYAACAAGLDQAKGILETIKTDVLSIVPIVSVIALIGMGAGFAMNMVDKSTFFKWGTGLLIVGSATKITEMLLN